MMLISIVVPVYNAEKYLEECLQSIIKQDNGQIEIVLIDDGSTDGSPEVCDKYAQRYKYIEAYHKENEGTYQARLDGARKASGDYVWFVDADDWIIDGAIKKLSAFINSDTTIDLILFGMLKDGKGTYEFPVEFEEDSYNGETVNRLKSAFCRTSSFNSVWGKLIKRCLIVENPLVTDNINYLFGEDSHLCFAVLDRTNKAIMLKDSLYAYRSNFNSMTNSFNPQRIYNNILCGTFQKEMSRKWGENENYSNYIDQKFIKEEVYIIKDILKSNLNWNIKKKYIIEMISSDFYREEWNKSKNSLSGKDRLILYLTYRLNFIFLYTINVIYRISQRCKYVIKKSWSKSSILTNKGKN